MCEGKDEGLEGFPRKRFSSQDVVEASGLSTVRRGNRQEILSNIHGLFLRNGQQSWTFESHIELQNKNTILPS